MIDARRQIRQYQLQCENIKNQPEAFGKPRHRVYGKLRLFGDCSKCSNVTNSGNRSKQKKQNRAREYRKVGQDSRPRLGTR